MLVGGFAAFIVVQSLKARARKPAGRAPADSADTIYNVPVHMTAADRVRRAGARATAAQARITAEGRGTYIQEVLDANDSTVRRWPGRADTPVTVWIQTPGVLADFHLEYRTEVERALAAWGAAADVPVRFAVQVDSATANVRVLFTLHFADNRIGLTRIEAINDTIRQATITIATQRTEGAPLALRDVTRCALHEVGHLLGLAHTSDSTSIMAPESTRQELSDRDRRTAQLLYALPPGSIRRTAIR